MSMSKGRMTILLVACMVIAPLQIFGATKNHIPYISTTGIDSIQSTQVIIDNTDYDLKPGQYFTISLENAEFDLEDEEIQVRSNSFEFGSLSRKSVDLTLKDSVTEGSIVSFSFYSKILGGDAKVIIDPEDSGISSGTYVYATTSKLPMSYKGKIEPITPMFFDDSLIVPPIIIKEQSDAAFRSIQMYNTDNEDLITLKPKSDTFNIRNAEGYHGITFVVEDGKGTERRYELGRDPEVEFNYTTNKLAFKRSDDDIFDALGQRYTIRIENMEIKSDDDETTEENIELVFGGLLVGEQTITFGQRSLEPLKLEATEKELIPGTKQTIKFVLDEQRPNTLFKDSYINLGVYGGGMINAKSDLTFTLKDGVNTYTELEKSAFKLVFDPIGDRVTIEGYRRKDTTGVMKLEGEITITVPEEPKKDIEFFVSEPSLAETVKQTVLKRTEDVINPPTPEIPTPEVPEPVKAQVDFKVDEAYYKVDGVSHPMEAKSYVSTHNRIMVPVRYVAYALGVQEKDVRWNQQTGDITISGDKPMTISTRTKEMNMNYNITTLSEIKVVEGRTFVPVGEIGKAFGAKVTWDGQSRTARFN